MYLPALSEKEVYGWLRWRQQHIFLSENPNLMNSIYPIGGYRHIHQSSKKTTLLPFPSVHPINTDKGKRRCSVPRELHLPGRIPDSPVVLSICRTCCKAEQCYSNRGGNFPCTGHFPISLPREKTGKNEKCKNVGGVSTDTPPMTFIGGIYRDRLMRCYSTSASFNTRREVRWPSSMGMVRSSISSDTSPS